MPHPTPSPSLEPNSRHRAIELVDASVPLWIISDLHLGDGTPSDVFFDKDRQLVALIDRADRCGAVVAINGDAIDFHQAWSLDRVLRAHPLLFSAMSALARKGRLIYVVGNHDWDIALFREILHFRVCDELRVVDADGAIVGVVTHGMEFDPYIQSQLESGQWDTKIHHMIERGLDTWIRIPLGEFYTLANRLSIWAGHKLGLFHRFRERIRSVFWGVDPSRPRPRWLENLDFWAQSNMGDSMGIFRPACAHLQASELRFLVCGHSHVPGVVTRNGKSYANTGSWTFRSSTYVVWDGRTVTCRDWISGREFGEELFEPMLSGWIYERTFFDWWRENYLGWFRFREGEDALRPGARAISPETDRARGARLG